jgi:guanosine-3',5'-bis(diphosphate) 3'-pyrophosphohydrolase
MVKMQSGMLDKVRAVLTTGTDKESFFEIISRLYPTLDPRYIAIEKAYDAMKDAFRGKSRESGERYFEHLRSVALIMIQYLRVKDFELIMAGLLHDASEDVEYWPVPRIRRSFGNRVAMYVERLDKGNKVELETADREFFLIKLSDRLHNLLTLGACPRDKIRRKIDETKLRYVPYSERYLILYHEISAVIEELEENHFKEEKKTECCGANPVCV